MASTPSVLALCILVGLELIALCDYVFSVIVLVPIENLSLKTVACLQNRLASNRRFTIQLNIQKVVADTIQSCRTVGTRRTWTRALALKKETVFVRGLSCIRVICLYCPITTTLPLLIKRGTFFT